MGKFTALKGTADSLIAKFGASFTGSRVGSSSTWTKKYDPVLMESYWENSVGDTVTTEPADTVFTYTGSVVIAEWSLKQKEGTTILEGDKKLVIASDELVMAGDTLTFTTGPSYQLTSPISVTDPANDGHVVQEANGRHG